MIQTDYVIKNGKQLKKGFTTGSCAAAAASGAAILLLTGQAPQIVTITMPNGDAANFEVSQANIKGDRAFCSVIKDAGDDPDVTHGLPIMAEVYFSDSAMSVSGGEGVGRVTQEGLPNPVGAPAINPVPRRMIIENLRSILEQHGEDKLLSAIIHIPGGAQVARKTFNPRLGIVGGLSVLGTTGIVEPMSEAAIIDTIKICIDQKFAQDPRNIIIAPGNYGLAYLKSVFGLDESCVVKISNFIGETLDYLVYKGFQRVLFAGHIGKMVKIAGGTMNTHSKYADGRMETLAAHSALLGADKSLIRELFDCVTTKAALSRLAKEGFYPELCRNLVDKMEFHLSARSHGKIEFGLVVFGDDDKLIAQSQNISTLSTYFRRNYGG